MSYLSTPQPDEPQPAGTTPNQPKDPGVYGGQWGPGDGKPKNPPPDQPEKISPPAEDEGNRTPDTPSANQQP